VIPVFFYVTETLFIVLVIAVLGGGTLEYL
jgi:hypothetical protein